MKLKDFIGELQNRYLPDTEIVPVFWQADDATARAEDRGMTLTDEEAGQIVSALGDNHDASIGINWDVIDFYLDDMERQREGENA